MRRQKILLVNIRQKHRPTRVKTFVSLALLKLATYYKSRGCAVEYIVDGQRPKATPDIICFSLIFPRSLRYEAAFIKSYAKAYSAAKIKIGGPCVAVKENELRKLFPKAEIHKGLDPRFDLCAPDYKMAKVGFSYGFTSRGCIRHCKWCIVPIAEGKFKVVDEWRQLLGEGHKLFSCMDNNVLVAGPDHYEAILQEMKARKMQVDFNQAMDVRLFAADPAFIELTKKYINQFELIRFAWDGKHQKKPMIEALELIRNEYKLRKIVRVLMLYGFQDTPEEIFERIKIMHKYNVTVKPMRYIDFGQGIKNRWNGADELFAKFISSHAPAGVIGPGANWFGDTFDEFMDNIARFTNLKNGAVYDTATVEYIRSKRRKAGK